MRRSLCTADHDANTSTATDWDLLVWINIVGLTGHELVVDLAWGLTTLKATVLEDGILNCWWFTWWLVLATLWLTLDPLTTLAMELPDIWPSGWNKVAITLAD